jgi:hypothetical protein
MGGPPFSGFALVPQAVVEGAAELPSGLTAIFRRAEWPADWPGAGQLPEEANLGLLLRLEASIFELERFQAIPIERVERVVLAFHAAVRTAFVERLGGRRLAPYEPGARAEGDSHPVKCVKLADGRWGATLRVGISMPQVTAFDRLDDAALTARLTADMAQIVDAIAASTAG